MAIDVSLRMNLRRNSRDAILRIRDRCQDFVHNFDRCQSPLAGFRMIRRYCSDWLTAIAHGVTDGGEDWLVAHD